MCLLVHGHTEPACFKKKQTSHHAPKTQIHNLSCIPVPAFLCPKEDELTLGICSFLTCREKFNKDMCQIPNITGQLRLLRLKTHLDTL